MNKTTKKDEKKQVVETKKKGLSKEERYTENGEDKIKTTYSDGTVIVSTL